jgi:chitin deacetylase
MKPPKTQRQVPSSPTPSKAAWARGKVVGRVRIKPTTNVVALTFDDGPWPRETDRVLAVLKEHKVKATFFMIGRHLETYPQIARRVRDAGHEIGSHSWNHSIRPRGARSEITRTDAILKRLLKQETPLFRPPFGALHNGMAKNAKALGKTVVLWSADSNDWDHASADSIYNKVMLQTRPGGIILLHDGGGDRTATVQALPRIIKSLRSKGYRFVTVPELLALRVPPPNPSSKIRSVAGQTRKRHIAHPQINRRVASKQINGKSAGVKPLVVKQAQKKVVSVPIRR